MAIYPILDGQTLSNSGTTQPPVSSKELPDTKPSEQAEDNLIDFGGDAAEITTADPVPPQANNEIEKMLQATGKPAEGSLIDFIEEAK